MSAWRGRLLELAAVTGILWLLGGRLGLAMAAVFVVYDLLRAPAPRDLLALAVLCLALVPLAVLARGLPARSAIGPDFVQGNLVAHHLAFAGLALLVIGVLREVRAEPEEEAGEPEAGGEPEEPPRQLPPRGERP